MCNIYTFIILKTRLNQTANKKKTCFIFENVFKFKKESLYRFLLILQTL